MAALSGDLSRLARESVARADHAVTASSTRTPSVPPSAKTQQSLATTQHTQLGHTHTQLQLQREVANVATLEANLASSERAKVRRHGRGALCCVLFRVSV